MRTATLFFGIALACGAVSWAQGTDSFVRAANGQLSLNGSTVRFGGGDSYVLMFSTHDDVDQILGTAASNHFTAVRMWAFDDVASGGSDSFYLQSFSGGTPQYNDGADGLANVDYAVYRAGQLGLKLIVPFVNNWPDYGGMDQYVDARGLQYHDQFYTDATIRQWYKNWISHLLNHVNTISGVAYKDDPTIMIWELANEPRCQGTGLPSSNSCTTQTIISWITDVSAYVKSVDANHLVSVGDEGFFCVPSSTDYIDNCSTGVDSIGFAQVQNVDLMGFHLYPDAWDRDLAWADGYIDQHVSEGTKTLGKPVYMGEFGLLIGNVRNSVYDEWTSRIFNDGGSGALFWDILPGQPPAADAEPESDYDIEAGSPLLLTVGDFAQMMAANSALSFPPVAGDQWANASYNSAATLYPLGNDVAYRSASIDPASIDLDPSTPGQQSSVTVYGGAFNIVGQSVQFTPSSGFDGVAQCAYTVADTNGAVSNIAYMSVSVNASPTGPKTLESFETGTDGWAAESSSGAAGTVAQTSVFHTDGSYGLQVNVTAGGWFGVEFPTPVDLSGRPSISIDIQTPANVQSSAIAFQSGSNFVWCQNATWPTIASNTSTTVTIQLDVSQLQCFGGAPTFSSVSAVWVALNGTGTFYLDNLRAAAPTVAPPAPLVPTIGGVANSASGQSGAASGAFLSIFGTNFLAIGTPSTTWSGWIANGNLPTTLAGVSVSIGGQAAYVYSASSRQINVLAPYLPAGSTEVVVTNAAGSSDPFTVTSQLVQPAFFTWGNYAVATHSPDFSLAVKNGTFGVSTVPAKPGDVIVLWSTGLGVTSPVAPMGQPVPAKLYSIPGVTVTVGGTAAKVYGAALAPGLAGVYQVAIQIPNLSDGDYPVVETVNGVQSPASVMLTVQQ